MSKPKLTLVGDGTPGAPYISVTEAQVAGQQAWTRTRRLHVRLLAKVNSVGLLRLHASGALPHEDVQSKPISVHTLSGMARELREIEALAAEAAALLEETSDRMRRS